MAKFQLFLGGPKASSYDPTEDMRNALFNTLSDEGVPVFLTLDELKANVRDGHSFEELKITTITIETPDGDEVANVG